MVLSHHIMLLLLFFSGGVSLILLLFSLANTRTTLNHLFSLLAAAVAVYCFGYGFEVWSTTLEEMLFWSKVQYAGISFCPGLILSMVLAYTGRESVLTRGNLMLLFTVPVITLAARLSNPLHQLFYRTAGVDHSVMGPLLHFEPGPFYDLHMLYVHAVWFLSSGLLVLFLLRAAPTYRCQALIMLAASMIQWTGLAVYLMGLGPDNIDINPLLLSFSVCLYAVGIFRFSLLRLVPVARDRVFENMRDGVMVVDADLCLVDFNQRCASLFPGMSKQWIGRHVKTILNGFPEIVRLVGEQENGDMELALLENDTHRYFHLFVIPLYGVGGRVVGRIMNFNDISAQKQLISRLEQMAVMDDLTGIFNRRQLIVQAGIELKRATRNNRPMALMLMDLDHFKTVNDTWGHHCGDVVLKAFADKISNHIRDMDVFARYGGEEFVAVFPEMDRRMAFKTAERLCRLIDGQPVHVEGQDIPVTVSIGVTGTWVSDVSCFDDMIKAADKVLYLAKKAGRNRVMMDD